ncbi:NmrA-like family domain-containing oxidoreductase himF [Paramyrothecium foliicola]|nr:NmrA-like family domain-containing oxidoreductase himF [Paramyrothecium foliicola]
MSSLTVFVCGVTGIQGGAVARQLRAAAVEVHALARNITSANALDMQALGVKLWPGDYDATEALESAMAGCSAAFINFMPDFNDFGAELRWAKSIFSVAHAVGVNHVIYSSGVGVNAPETLEHWDPNTLAATFILSKQTIENELCKAGFQHWTILRPGAFMTNYTHPHVFMYPGLVDHGVWETAIRTDTILPFVDILTIGKFATAAFLDPVKFHSQEIEYADECLAIDEIMTKFSKATGRDLKAVNMRDEDIEAQRGSNPFIQGQLIMRNMVKLVDMEKVKSWGVPLSSVDAFLGREKERVLATYQQED